MAVSDARSRLQTLRLIVKTPEERERIDAVLAAAGDDAQRALDVLSASDAPLARQVELARTLVEWSRFDDRATGVARDDTALIQSIANEQHVGSLADLASTHGLPRLIERVARLAPAAPPGAPETALLFGAPPEIVERARELRSRLYRTAPLPVLERMIKDREITIDAEALREEVRSHDIADDKRRSAARGLEEATDAGLLLRALRRAVELAPKSPEIAGHLLEHRLTTAASIAAIPVESFVALLGPVASAEEATEVHEHAVDDERRRRDMSARAAARLQSMNAVLARAWPADEGGVPDRLTATLSDVGGDVDRAVAALTDGLDEKALRRLRQAEFVSRWTNDDALLASAIVTKWPELDSVEAAARGLGAADLLAIVAETMRNASSEDASAPLTRAAVPVASDRESPETSWREAAAEKAAELHDRLYRMAPRAVLAGLVERQEWPIADTAIRVGVLRLIETSSIRPAVASETGGASAPRPEAVATDDGRVPAGARQEFNAMRRLIAVGVTGAPVLRKAGLASTFEASEIPEAVFVRRFGDAMGSEETARRAHQVAVDIRIRNESLLMAAREAVRGTGLAVLDGDETIAGRLARLWDLLGERPGGAVAAEPLPDFRRLFGTVDTCECGHCNSVYSPSAYFVELLNFVRNNNLGPDPAHLAATNPDIHPGISGTPLEQLFRRRPDLGDLQLTCENAMTAIPHIDLANEIMESFIVHRDEYRESGTTPEARQTTLDAHDVVDETTAELLSEPRHTNLEAYCTLSKAVYPFTLPYHQPIDAIRSYLDFLKSSREQLLDTYRRAPLPRDPNRHPRCFPDGLSDEQYAEYVALHAERLQRAVDAETLGLTEEEYVILCREGFWKRHYYELLPGGRPYTPQEYRELLIHVQPPHRYFGFADAATMTASLPRVDDHLMRRTGLAYADLVELLKTRFVNPLQSEGMSRRILGAIPFAYRSLLPLVDPHGATPRRRLRRVIELLTAVVPGTGPPRAH